MANFIRGCVDTGVRFVQTLVKPIISSPKGQVIRKLQSSPQSTRLAQSIVRQNRGGWQNGTRSLRHRATSSNPSKISIGSHRQTQTRSERQLQVAVQKSKRVGSAALSPLRQKGVKPIKLKQLNVMLLRLPVTQNLQVRSLPSKRRFSGNASGCPTCALTASDVNAFMQDFIKMHRKHGAVVSGNVRKFPRCQWLRDDTFTSPSTPCAVSQAMERYARGESASMPGVKVDPDSSRLFLSPLLKSGSKTEGLADLTGDGGRATLEMFKRLEESGRVRLKEIEAVIDIGGLDTEFVGQLPIPNKVIVDMNLLTPLLSTPRSDVTYLIGSAESVLKKYGLEMLARQDRGPILFNMSNFLSVLPAEEGAAFLKFIRSCMKKGDKLSITNLERNHFNRLLSHYEMRSNTGSDGLLEVSKKGKDQLYKTVVDPEKLTTFLENQNIEVLGSEVLTRDIKVGDRTFPGQFFSSVFEVI